MWVRVECPRETGPALSCGRPWGEISTWQAVLSSSSVSQRDWEPGIGVGTKVGRGEGYMGPK